MELCNKNLHEHDTVNSLGTFKRFVEANVHGLTDVEND